MKMTTEEYTGQELSVFGFVHITGLAVQTIKGFVVISQLFCLEYGGTIGHRRKNELVITMEGFAWFRPEKRLSSDFLQLLLRMGVDLFSKNPLVPDMISEEILDKRRADPLWYPN